MHPFHTIVALLALFSGTYAKGLDDMTTAALTDHPKKYCCTFFSAFVSDLVCAYMDQCPEWSFSFSKVPTLGRKIDSAINLFPARTVPSPPVPSSPVPSPPVPSPPVPSPPSSSLGRKIDSVINLFPAKAYSCCASIKNPEFRAICITQGEDKCKRVQKYCCEDAEVLSMCEQRIGQKIICKI